MFGRVGKWAVAALAGGLIIAGVAAFTSSAQGPAPAQTPQATCPMGGPGAGFGFRFGGAMLDTLASALNMKVDALTQALQSGKTVADLAKAQNMTLEQVVDKLIAARKATLQQAVDAGRITQQQMDAALNTMRTQMLENLQNGVCAPGLGPGYGHRAGADNHGTGFGSPMRGMGRGRSL